MNISCARALSVVLCVGSLGCQRRKADSEPFYELTPQNSTIVTQKKKCEADPNMTWTGTQCADKQAQQIDVCNRNPNTSWNGTTRTCDPSPTAALKEQEERCALRGMVLRGGRCTMDGLQLAGSETGGGTVWDGLTLVPEATAPNFYRLCQMGRDAGGDSVTVDAIRSELGEADCQKVMTKFATLESLSLNERGIVSIAALRGARKLKSLSLRNNGIFDISPLRDLRTLTFLDLQSNHIRDVSALADLNQLEYLNLSHNPELESVLPLRALARISDVFVGDTGLAKSPSKVNCPTDAAAEAVRLVCEGQ